MSDTRNKIETNRRGLLSDEIQELSKQEMESVSGGVGLLLPAVQAAREAADGGDGILIGGWGDDILIG